MKLDTNQEGLHCLYSPHTAKLLQHLWVEAAVNGRGISIKDLHEWYNVNAEKWGLPTRSRAAIALSLKELEEDGVVEFYEVSGQGGYKRMYYQAMAPLMFTVHVQDKMNGKQGDIFKGPWWKP